MADLSNVAVPVLIAATINIVARAVEDGVTGGMGVAFANAALFTTLAGIGQLLSWDLAGTLSLVYLLATMLTTGRPVLEWFIKLLDGTTKTTGGGGGAAGSRPAVQ